MKQARVLPRLFAGLIVSLSLALPAFGLETFPEEAKAQQHCPKDVVVWLNLPTMIWHWKGQRWYAQTKHGAFACEKDVPSVPAPPDPPSLNKKPAAGHDGEERDSDSLYNVWLDKEYFHNPRSGENYWVSPSSDYQRNGPQGPGYYANYGNDVIKLQSGYAQ